MRKANTQKRKRTKDRANHKDNIVFSKGVDGKEKQRWNLKGMTKQKEEEEEEEEQEKHKDSEERGLGEQERKKPLNSQELASFASSPPPKKLEKPKPNKQVPKKV